LPVTCDPDPDTRAVRVSVKAINDPVVTFGSFLRGAEVAAVNLGDLDDAL
jgi:hypothetical protein